MQKLNRQHGGTILGIIIGLVIGLGIALAVAVVITKTPIPFTNKFARPEKAAEPTAGQRADPNQPLYGNKSAARDAAKDLAKPPVVPSAPANTAAPPTDNKAPVVELSPNVDKPKKADATENAEDKWSYLLQAGAFRSQTDAESLRAKLALIGVEAKVSERQSENGVLYRVRVGPFSQLDAMNRIRTKMSDNGVDAAVVRIARQ
jgi:cell division protein FtsN